MDASAIALARDNDLPIIVFSLDEPGGFKGILSGKGTYTRVQAEAPRRRDDGSSDGVIA
jgi:uridylate kinase